MAAVGAYYILQNVHIEFGKMFLRVGVTVGVIAALLQLYPTGDGQGVMIAKHQKITLAAMEGLFHSQENAPLAILGQPDVQNQRLDNPLTIPSMLSFLTYKQWSAKVDGLDHFPQSEWPDNIPLLYFSYHIMVGLGTLFIAILVLAAWLSGTRKALRIENHAVDHHARAPVSIHCQYSGMDHRRSGAPAVAHLRPDANKRRSFIESFGGKRVVHSYWISRYVHDSRNSFPFSRLSRNRSRPRTAGPFARK